MTVKILIEKLKEMPPDAEVFIVHNEWSIKKIKVSEDKKNIRIQ